MLCGRAVGGSRLVVGPANGRSATIQSMDLVLTDGQILPFLVDIVCYFASGFSTFQRVSHHLPVNRRIVAGYPHNARGGGYMRLPWY